MSYMIEEKVVEHAGFKIRVSWYPDEGMDPPWKAHDGHGPVSDWTTRDKAPGELVIASDGNSKRYYDFKEAVKIALRDRWDAEPYNKDGRETKKQQAAKAARADFEYLKEWCDDKWSWVYYELTVRDAAGVEVKDDSLCGIDSPSIDEYTDEVISDAKEWIDNELDGRLDAACRDIETVNA